MKVTFAIRYKAEVGQELSLVGNGTASNQEQKSYQLTLTLEGEDLWIGDLDLEDTTDNFTYNYEVRSRNNSEILRQEPKRFCHNLVCKGKKNICAKDTWIEAPKHHYRYHNAFWQVLYPQNLGTFQTINLCEKSDNECSITLDIEVLVPAMGQKLSVYLLGESEIFGAWQKEKALDLTCLGGGLWALSLQIDKQILEQNPYQAFKFVLMDEGRERLIWEEGENRALDCSCDLVHYDKLSFSGLNAGFSDEILKEDKFAGVVIPLFSLRSKQDCGIGDFGTLKLAIDWAKATRMKVLQLLPINDTTFYRDWRDSYPYNAISVKALHPIYVDLKALAPLKDKSLRKLYREVARALRKEKELNYPEVLAYKEAYLRRHYVEHLDEILNNQDFLNFYASEKSWLEPYVVYCLLRDGKFASKEFAQWENYQQYHPRYVAELKVEEGREKFMYYAYVQYLLAKQLEEARAYADSCGVLLKGDIPIGVAPHSVDVWCEPELFNFDMSAGAPPDDFAQEGQNWGFPTYNWDKMKEDNYAWWRGRLQSMAKYFSAYRIDHILGFFRIWEVPRSEQSALLGHFTPAMPLDRTFWEENFPKQDFKLLKAEALVEDPKQKGKYHPRITFDKAKAYKLWTKEEQEQWQSLKNDYFYKRHNELWRVTAMERLKALLDSSGMLACAEDLGMLTDTVPQVLKDLELLSLDLERMPKTLAQGKWAKVQDFPYLSVCTTSTHDMPSLRGWWQTMSGEDKLNYIKAVLEGDEGLLRKDKELFSRIIRNHLRASSMAVILPLADWLSIDPKLSKQNSEEEQINHPEDPNNKWCYRMPFAIDSQAKDLLSWQKKISQMIEEEGRY